MSKFNVIESLAQGLGHAYQVGTFAGTLGMIRSLFPVSPPGDRHWQS